MAEGKYYWLKLKRDFFKRHDIRIIEGMPNGKDYILFYLKLLCESVDHEGNLRFSESIPYNEDMLATITNTNVDIVRSAIKIFTELGMMDIMDDGTFYMSEVKKMIGSETEWAEKKRLYRAKQKQLGQPEDIVQTESDKSQSKSKSIEKEIDIEKEYIVSLHHHSICDGLSQEEWDDLDNKFEDLNGLIDLIDGRLGLNTSSIKNSYKYILQVGKDEGWATK